MRVTGVDHIGIGVADLDAALEFFVQRIGLTAAPIEVRADIALRIARLQVGGVELELIEAQDWSRTTQAHLPHKGPGVYHFGLRVDDVYAAVGELTAAGVPMIDQVPRDGESIRIAFVHPDAASGALIELVTRK